jgi:hypothetical protein
VTPGWDERASRIIVESARKRSETAALLEQAALLQAESSAVLEQSRALRCEHNVLLETAVKIVSDFLERRGFALAEPVSARLHTTPSGSTGVDVTVRVEDPGETDAVRAAIDEHFGTAGVDVVRVS